MVSSLRMSQEGKQNSMLYLAGLPLWEAILLVVILPTIIAVCGQLLVRKSVGLERLTTNNEIAGFKFATVGVIFAVIVAFAVIVVWEKFAEAESCGGSRGGSRCDPLPACGWLRSENESDTGGAHQLPEARHRKRMACNGGRKRQPERHGCAECALCIRSLA